MADDMREDYDFRQGSRGAVIQHPGQTRVTLWIDTEVLDGLRANANRDGHDYQAAINAALRQSLSRDTPRA